MATIRRRFTPYRPPTPPAGMYDPALDAQFAASQRGLGDLESQIGTQNARDATDYAAQAAAVQRQSGYNAQDLTTSRDRSLADLTRQLDRGQFDLGQARTRGTEDYDRNVQMLARQYGIQGRNQLQAANTAGVIRGGALLASAAKRQENQTLDRQPMDTNYQRFLADNSLSGQRMQEDYGTQTGRINEDFGTQTGRGAEATNTQLGQLALQYSPPDANNPLGGRAYQDRTTQLTQAQREQAFFGQDVQNAKVFQASGAGWDPPQRPANEFGSGASARRIVRVGNQSVAYGPSGNVLWRRPYRG